MLEERVSAKLECRYALSGQMLMWVYECRTATTVKEEGFYMKRVTRQGKDQQTRAPMPGQEQRVYREDK